MKFYDRNKELELTTTLRLVYLLDCKPALTYIIQAVDKSEGLSDYRRGYNPRSLIRQTKPRKGDRPPTRHSVSPPSGLLLIIIIVQGFTPLPVFCRPRRGISDANPLLQNKLLHILGSYNHETGIFVTLGKTLGDRGVFSWIILKLESTQNPIALL